MIACTLKVEYLITSHHPLRETLIAQTGFTTEKRRNFLQEAYSCATLHLAASMKWRPKQSGGKYLISLEVTRNYCEYGCKLQVI